MLSLEGGKILDSRGKDVWEEKCQTCQLVIQSGAKGYGTPRYHSLEQEEFTLCNRCYELRKSMKLWTTTTGQNLELFSKIFNDKREFSESDFVEEKTHSLFIRLNAFDKKRTLSQNLNQLLIDWGQRPFLGEFDQKNPKLEIHYLSRSSSKSITLCRWANKTAATEECCLHFS